MFFYYATESSTHIAVTHHQLIRADISPDLQTLRMWVDSWPAEQTRLDGIEAAAHWIVCAPVAGLQLKDGLAPAISKALCGSAEFGGATAIPDTSTGLVAARVRKWAEIKAKRASLEAGTFISGQHVFDVDAVNLMGATLDAYMALQNAEAYAQPWVLADNTAVQLTAAEMVAAGRACKAYLAGLWQISQALRGQIEAAKTPAEVAAIAWPG